LRSYINKKGEEITVTEEHLNVAVKIKKELQKASPSGKCNWSLHKKMMEKEGYDNSDRCETYRQLIKRYQKSIGELPEVAKYVDMVSDNKLESIKELVGELSYAKRNAQNQFRELNKVKRNVIDKTLFIEEVVDNFKDVKFEKFKKHNFVTTENEIVVPMTDWHIGLKTDSYDYEIAKKRVEKYANEVFHYCKLFNVNKVKVIGVGDLVEGGYMRPTQSYDIEFTFSEQIVKATEIVNSFLLTLAEELDVEYLGSVLGNHSRMYDKAVTISGDSAENIIDASVKSFISLIGNPNIKIIDKKNSNFDMSFDVNGRKVKTVHGDLLKKTSKEKINKFISSDNEFYDLLIYGHFHHMSFNEENHGRMTLGCGCLQGSTDYSIQLGYDTKPSQSIVVFEEDRILPIRIEL
jgi:hypothetical protein